MRRMHIVFACHTELDFDGTVTIRFEAGKVTHVETETRRMWQYKDLPGETRSAPE